jgi:2-dehydropantoate 2-reductase
MKPSMQEDSWPRIAVMGAGAVGCYFGGMLARAGAPVTLIGRPYHIDAIARDSLFMETSHFREQIPIAASSQLDIARNAEVVLLCVKTLDTETAAQSLARHLPDGSVMVSMQNGVDNVERIRSAAGIAAIPAVVYVAAEMTGPGRVKHTGRGDLVIGTFSQGDGKSELEKLRALFARAGIPCLISHNIEAELWTKLVMNCACNAISALSRARYGRIVHNPWTRELMKQVTEEVITVARAAGVRLPEVDLVDAVWKLGDAMANATSSTAQDIARGKLTEIDSLNGYVARRGAELNVPTPINRTLHALVKLLEEKA